MRYLSELTPEQRQPILDELEGRFRAESKGMKPVYDEVSFLHSLCNRVRRGKFQPNLGIKVRDGRCHEKKSDPKGLSLPLPRPPEDTEERKQRRKAVSQAEIAKMRKRLGMRASTGDQDVTSES